MCREYPTFSHRNSILNNTCRSSHITSLFGCHYFLTMLKQSAGCQCAQGPVPRCPATRLLTVHTGRPDHTPSPHSHNNPLLPRLPITCPPVFHPCHLLSPRPLYRHPLSFPVTSIVLAPPRAAINAKAVPSATDRTCILFIAVRWWFGRCNSDTVRYFMELVFLFLLAGYSSSPLQAMGKPGSETASHTPWRPQGNKGQYYSHAPATLLRTNAFMSQTDATSDLLALPKKVDAKKQK